LFSAMMGVMPARGPFAGTAWYYARFRPGYPPAFVDAVVRRFRLDGTGRLLDLGCGAGQLTVPLAPHVGEAVGVDPESEMLRAAAVRARAAGVANARWVPGGSDDLPGALGRFRLATMGRSFHWMDRDRVLAALAGMVAGDGGVVVVGDSCLVRPGAPWQRTVDAVQRRFLAPTRPPGEPASARAGESHEAVLARSAFRRVEPLTYEFSRRWTVEQVVGYLYSTSFPLRRLLGDRRPAFERALAEALGDGDLVEAVRLQALIATRARPHDAGGDLLAGGDDGGPGAGGNRRPD
jgi:SAM-dependent methyltransferase